MSWILKKLQEREEYKIDKFYTDLLMLFVNNKINTLGFCLKGNFKYHWRSQLFYDLRSFRKDRKQSFHEINGDLKRTYILGCMLRNLKKTKM